MTNTLLNQNDYSDFDNKSAAVVAAIAGTHPEGKRAGGLFIKEDLLDIKKYVKAGLALPYELSVVESYLGYKKINISGLEPEDIQVLYKKIRNNAINWNEVEIAVQSESNNLEITAGNITIAGKDILDILGEMPAVQKIKTLDK